MPNRTILILVIGFGLAALLAWWRPTPVRLRPPPRPESMDMVPTLPIPPGLVEEDSANGLLDPFPPGQPHTFTQKVNGVSFVMVQVEGGSFLMGDRVGLGSDDERPTHWVELDSYLLGQTEVTQALWRAVMGHNPSQLAGCDQCPVESVSWTDCQSFIGRLNQLTGRLYRLPTEAEWEYPARGGRHSDPAPEKADPPRYLGGPAVCRQQCSRPGGLVRGQKSGPPPARGPEAAQPTAPVRPERQCVGMVRRLARHGLLCH
jgi:formylglycine-generating enzyme required for sulfatase activity